MDPTQKQIDRWTKARNNALISVWSTVIVAAQSRQYDLARSHALTYNVNIDTETENFERTIDLVKHSKRMKRILEGVEDNTLGLRFKNGDIDIMGPPDLNEDLKVYYAALGGFLLIGIGVLIIVGFVAYTAILRSKLFKATRRWSDALHRCESKFCSDPDSPGCKAWLDTKSSKDWAREESIIEDAKEAIKGLGEWITPWAGGGIAIGIAVAIAILAWRNK